MLFERNRRNPGLTDLKVILAKFLRLFRLQSAKNKHFKKIRISLLVLCKNISSAFGQGRDKNCNKMAAVMRPYFPWSFSSNTGDGTTKVLPLLIVDKEHGCLRCFSTQQRWPLYITEHETLSSKEEKKERERSYFWVPHTPTSSLSVTYLNVHTWILNSLKLPSSTVETSAKQAKKTLPAIS